MTEMTPSKSSISSATAVSPDTFNNRRTSSLDPTREARRQRNAALKAKRVAALNETITVFEEEGVPADIIRTFVQICDENMSVTVKRITHILRAHLLPERIDDSTQWNFQQNNFQRAVAEEKDERAQRKSRISMAESKESEHADMRAADVPPIITPVTRSSNPLVNGRDRVEQQETKENDAVSSTNIESKQADHGHALEIASKPPTSALTPAEEPTKPNASSAAAAHLSPSTELSAMTSEQRLQVALSECIRGCTMWKIPRSSWSKPRLTLIRLFDAHPNNTTNDSVSLSLDHPYALCWSSAKSTKSERVFVLQHASLFVGQEHGTFASASHRKQLTRMGLNRVTHRSLSLTVQTMERTIDLIATHTNDYERFVLVLNAICQHK